MTLVHALRAIHHQPQRYRLGVVRISDNLFSAFDSWLVEAIGSYCRNAGLGKHTHRAEFITPQEPAKRSPYKNVIAPKDRVATSCKRICTVVTPLHQEHVHAALCHEIILLRHNGLLTVHRDGDHRAISFPVTPFEDDPKVHVYMDLDTFYIDYDLIEECSTATAVAAK